jgi:NADH-quinone oxidoreductase subunit L
VLLAISALVALGGAYLAYRAYVADKEIPKRVRASMGWLATLLDNKYYVDRAYNALIAQVKDAAQWLAGTFDQRGVDGAVNGVASVTGWVGAQARRLQTGLVGLYALSILFGAVALLAWFVIR